MGIIYGTDPESMNERFKPDLMFVMTNLCVGLKNFVRATTEKMLTDDSGSGGMTPQQKADLFGTSAGSLVQAGGYIVAAIQQADRSYVPPTPADYGYSQVINADGTITVTRL